MLLAGLVRHGYKVTAGVLNRLDTDEEACTALGIDHVVEPPFSPITTETLEACVRMVADADAVAVAEMPFGHGNLRNLELATRARLEGKTVLLFGESPIESRDFTGGEAARCWRELLELGAKPIAGLAALESVLCQSVREPALHAAIARSAPRVLRRIRKLARRRPTPL